MSKKIGILSLGCARNLVDSEVIAGRLKKGGYQIFNLDTAQDFFSDEKEQIDAVLLNTCAFIKEAKEESIETILDLIQLKKEGRLKKVIVAGCLSQRYKHKLFEELPEIDAFVGVTSLNHKKAAFRMTPSHYAYLKICEGCVSNCSFCVIPRIKTKFQSLPVNELISQIKALKLDGIREVNFIGQDITAYGWDFNGEFNLVSLLKKILKHSEGINWLRLLYLAPERLSDELIDLIAQTPSIVKYIDLPLQHINDRILRLMRRDITTAAIFKLIDKIRKRIPNVAIRTSLIVGFPTETEQEFEQLLSFVKRAKFERLGAFVYSREEATPAFGFKGQIPQKIKEERFNLLMNTQQEIASLVNQKFLGKVLEVLVEEKKEQSLYLGRTQYDAPEVDGLVYIKTKQELAIGNFADVKIIDTWEYDLVGEVKK